jgi:hypothetical protein
MKTTSIMAMALIFASFFFSDTARAQPLPASVIEQLQTLPLAQREAPLGSPNLASHSRSMNPWISS